MAPGLSSSDTATMDTCTSPPAHVPPEPCFQRARNHDAQAQAASLSSWQQHYEQLGAGRFEGLLEDLRFDQLQVFRETTNRSVLQDGSARSGHVTVGLADFEGGRASFCGHQIDPDTPIGIQADVPFQLVTAPRMTLVGISIPSATLQALAAVVDGPDTTDANDSAWQVPRSCVLRALGPRRLELQRLTSSALALGAQAAVVLGPAAARRTLGLALADAMLQCFRPEHVVADLPTCANSRQRIVRLAREYMQAHAESVITVPDLCEAAHTSRRALQYAFEDLLQVSPITYLRCMRLNRARRDLLRQARQGGGAGGGGVGDVAARWGFWHLSRFAGDYRALFGELPSATLGQGGCCLSVEMDNPGQR